MRYFSILLVLLFGLTSSNATTILVPADSATIQAGINGAVNGDTVLVADGTYTGYGNRDIDFSGKAVVVKSENGPEYTALDCGGSYAEPHRAAIFGSAEDSSSQLDGFTIRNGYGPFDFPGGWSSGGGILCVNSSSPLIQNCVFEDNHADRYGGAIALHSSSPEVVGCVFRANSSNYGAGAVFVSNHSGPTIGSCAFENNVAPFGAGLWSYLSDLELGNSNFEANAASNKGGAVHINYSTINVSNCVFRGNTADNSGGALNIYSSSEVSLNNCLFTGNSSDEGSGFYVFSSQVFSVNCTYVRNSTVENAVLRFNASPNSAIIRTIIAFSDMGEAIYVEGGVNTIECTDIFGNSGGDWVGSIAGYNGVDGNLSVDPMFCDTSLGDYHLTSSSLCAPTHNECTALIGAFDVGCVTIDEVSIEGETSLEHVIDNSPVFVWTYADTLGFLQSEFEIAVGTDDEWTLSEMWEPGMIVSSDTTVAYAGAALLDGSAYYLRLRLGDGSEWTRWYETSFRMNTAPEVPVVRSPEDGGVSGPIPELWITNASDPETDSLTYDFELYMDLAMEWIVKDTQGVREQPDSTGWNTGLTMTDNEPFWWRARSYDGYEYSEWTDLTVFYVNGTEQPPTVPETILPPDTSGLPVWDMLPTFTWSEVSDPDPFDTLFYYKLEIAVDSNFTYANDIDSIWATFYEVADSLVFGTRYWWRVSACDATDLCTTSEPGNFWTWTLGDMDHSHEADITDLSILIDNQFLTLAPIYPAFVGDVTGDCQIDITDISRFIDHLFLTLGPLEVGCE